MASFFIDTNVVVYSFAGNEPRKRGVARALLGAESATISVQVLSELAHVLTRRLGFTPTEARSRVASIAGSCEVLAVTPSVVGDALRVMERYGYSFYDSQIVAAALAAGTSTLYSEDLHDGQVIDGTLAIRSPFRQTLEQARPAYRAAGRRTPRAARSA